MESSTSMDTADTAEMIGLELLNAQNEIQRLKGRLLIKESAYQDLQLDANFHIIKTAELSEILEAAKRPDSEGILERLKVKAIQNVELTVQVQELRHHLNASLGKVERLGSDLQLSTATVHQLAEERKSHQRMLVELGDLVRALGRIEIGYEKSDSKNSKALHWMQPNDSLENIKRKINALEEDRQRRILENAQLQSELSDRGQEIDTLQLQNYRIQAIDQDRERLQNENHALRQDITTEAKKVDGLEQLFHNVNVTRSEAEQDHESVSETSIPNNVTLRNQYPQQQQRNVMEEPTGGDAIEVCSHFDGRTEILMTSSISKITDHDYMDADENSSFSTLEAPEEQQHECDEGIQETIVELVVIKDKYDKLQDQHATTSKRALDAETQLALALKKTNATKKKQEMREGLLRDVIFQYKQLQKEHDETMTRLTELEGMVGRDGDGNGINNIGLNHSSRLQNKRTRPKPNHKKQVQHQKQLQEQGEQPVMVEESSTFDTASFGSSSSCAAKRTTKGEEEDASIAGKEIEYFDESMMEEFRRLESECARLEHEYDDAIAQIANLEEDLKLNKAKVETAQQGEKDREQELMLLEYEYEQVQVDHEATLEQTNQRVQEELKILQSQAQKAQLLQKQREQDLWQVIDQYKQLTEANNQTRVRMQGVETELDETQAQMADVKHELSIARKQAKGRDLIYDYRKLEKHQVESSYQLKTKERELHLAKSEAAKSKEQSKCIRKRLAGCHFHYKQLQQKYDNVLSEKDVVEKAWTKSNKHVLLYKKQEESWTDKIVHIREQRKQSEDKNIQLQKENKDLQQYVEDLLVLASRSVIGLGC